MLPRADGRLGKLDFPGVFIDASPFNVGMVKESKGF
jgi:hypothetical protein